MSQTNLQKTQSIRSAAAEPGRKAGLRVIIVDDDPIFRSLASAKFLQSAGEVVEAEDGSVGWYRISTETFHLAVVDLDMPNMGGMDLIRCVRGHPRTAQLPVVVVTSRSPAEAVRDSLECGATSFLCKPVNWSMFSSHIDNLMGLYVDALKGRHAEEALQAANTRHGAELKKLRTEASDFAQLVLKTSRSALTAPPASQGDCEQTRALATLAETAEQFVVASASVPAIRLFTGKAG